MRQNTMETTKLDYADSFALRALEAQINNHTENIIHLIPYEEKDSASVKNTKDWKERQKMLRFHSNFFYH